MRLPWLVTTAVCGAVLLAPAYSGWALLGSRLTLGAPPDATQTTNKASELDRSAAPGRIAGQGRVEPISEVLDLAIGMVGTLTAVYVEEGDTIKKGQLLAELVNGDQQARVAEAEAQVRLRKAELEKLQHGARPEERRQAASQVQKTDASVALAKLELGRRRPLAANGVASQQSLEQAVSSVQVAEANDSVNRAALELINAPPRAEDVAIAEANLGLAEANLDAQRVLLQKTQLRSPIDGMVLRRYLKTGETISIQPLIPILQVGDPRRLRVRAEIDETEIGHLELGQLAWANAPAYPARRFTGVIARIGQRMGRKTVRSDEPTEKSDTNVLEVLIDLDDPGVRLPIGLRINVFVDPSGIAKN
jgi:HlyD family secretion protein